MHLSVMTGTFGAGKTTWIGRMLDEAAARDIPTSGVYTPAVFEGDEKTAIDAMLLPSRQRFLLAPKRYGVMPDGVRMLGWDFQEDAVRRINEHLVSCAGASLLVIDELGPLEFMRGEGYTEGLRLLDDALVESALVVIRPSLLDAARERWGGFAELSPASDIDGFLNRVGA